MSKHLLDIDYDFDFDVIGICSAAKYYKVVWAINQLLDINLERADDDHTICSKEGGSTHGVFMYHCEETHIEYQLIVNRGSGDYAVPEYKQVDFFLLLYDNILLKPADVVSDLRKINFVSTALTIDVEKLKSKENLITN